MNIKLGAVLVCGVLVGCGDSGGDSASMSNSESQSGTTAGSEPTTEPTGGSVSDSMTEGMEGGMSMSQSGSTGAEGGMSESLSMEGGGSNESISGSGTTSGETGMISGGGETSNSTEAEVGEVTGPAIDCGEIVDEQMCIDAGCQAVHGQHLFNDDAIWCVEPPVFLGCIEMMACADVLTVVCKGDNKYLLPDACAPEGFSPCPAPPDQGGNGYPDCQ